LTRRFRPFAQHLGGLVAADTSAPLAAVVFIFVGEVGFGRADEGSELLLVLALDVLQGDDGSGLLVHHCAETGFTLDDDIWHTHLPAESGDEDDELDGVDVVGDHYERGLLGFDERDTVVQAVFNEEGFLGLLLFLSVSSVFGLCVQTGFLLLLCLRTVLVKELEELGSSVLVQGVGELGKRRRDLETTVEDNLLALKTDVFGPFEETGQVGLGLNVLTDSKVFRPRLEERVFGGLGLTLGEGCGCGFLTGLFYGLVIETMLVR